MLCAPCRCHLEASESLWFQSVSEIKRIVQEASTLGAASAPQSQFLEDNVDDYLDDAMEDDLRI